MPALNFMARFADAVERGEKRQTIRKYRKDGRDPKPGDKLYLFTGQRTKKCRRLVVQRTVEVIRRAVTGLPFGHVVECRAIEPVIIFRRGIVWPDETIPFQEGERIARGESAEIEAIKDGLDTYAEMVEIFEQLHGLPFEGLLIRW